MGRAVVIHGVNGGRGKKYTSYRDEALKAAKDLQYPGYVLDDIRAAKSDRQISIIMANARHEASNKEGK